jgi:hypothetical protein
MHNCSIREYTVTKIVFHRLVEVNNVKESMIQCVIEFFDIWGRVDTILLFIHYLLPFILYVYSFVMTMQLAAQSRSSTQHQSFLSSFWIQIKKCKKQLICPILMIVSSLPQLIIAFAVDCDQWYTMWLRHLI